MRRQDGSTNDSIQARSVPPTGYDPDTHLLFDLLLPDGSSCEGRRANDRNPIVFIILLQVLEQ
jgi:hypothetical protein